MYDRGGLQISLEGGICLCGCNYITLLISWQGAGVNSSYLLSLSMFLFDTAYSDYYHLDQKSMTGIVVGVCIALTCILICILILIYRSKARYVFVLKDWALFQCTHSSPPRVLSSLKCSVSSPVSASVGNKALCWLFLFYLSAFFSKKEEEPAERVMVLWQLSMRHVCSWSPALGHISMLLFIVCSSCWTLQPAHTWLARLYPLGAAGQEELCHKGVPRCRFQSRSMMQFLCSSASHCLCLSSPARGYKLAQWLCPELWDQSK